MGFLSKIKKKSAAKDDLPPPPPAMEGAPKKDVKTKDATAPPVPDDLPPLPDAPSAEDDSDDMPPVPEAPDSAMPQMPEMPKMPEASDSAMPQMPEAPDKQAVPKAPSAAPQTSPEPAAPQPAPQPDPEPEPAPQTAAPKNNPRQQIRDAFSDIPPIKVDDDSKGVITKEQVKGMDVDKFVLPGQKPEPEPEPEPAPQPAQPAPQPEPAFEGPLYVDVDTYEDVQKAIKELKKQLSDITTDMEEVRNLTNKEDKQFSVVVKKLEKIQEDILRVDQDLFEER